jgi:hypothetical protein
VKPGILCLLLLSGCAFPDDLPPAAVEYALTWICQSPEGCERSEEVARLDRVTSVEDNYHFTSTQDASFVADAEFVSSDPLPSGCFLLYFLSLFGHELEPSRLCHAAASFELRLSIPNQDPTTFSMWLVEGRDVDVF